jgi:hypothetical protein
MLRLCSESNCKIKINMRKGKVKVCSKNPGNINIIMDDDTLNQVPKFKYLRSIFTEDVKNREGITQIKQPTVWFNNNQQIFCSNFMAFLTLIVWRYTI